MGSGCCRQAGVGYLGIGEGQEVGDKVLEESRRIS